MKEEWKIDTEWTYAGLERFLKAHPGAIVINMPVDIFALGGAGAIILAEAVGTEKALERANLIANAPDLLEALENLADTAPQNGNWCFFCNMSVYGNNDTDEHAEGCELAAAQSLIARAKGEA